MHARTVFDHIPRTAGTSVKAALARAIGESGEIAETSCSHAALLSMARPARRFVASHLWFYPGEILSPDFLYATLLREPVDRFLSQYFFFRAHREQVLSGAITDPDVVAAASGDLDTYIADPERARSFTNVQARHFAWRVCDAPQTLDDKSLLDAAIASLDEFDLVGVSPEAQSFLDAYCDLLSVPRQTIERLNAARKRTGVPMSTTSAEQLWQRNMVDTALYNWARKRSAGRRFARTRRSAPQPSTADFGSGRIRIMTSRCSGIDSESPVVSTGEAIVVRLACRSSVEESDLTVGIAVRDERGTLVYGTNSRRLGTPVAVAKASTFDFSFLVDGQHRAGKYHVTLAIHKGLSHEEGCYHWRDGAASFLVLPEIPRREPQVKSDGALRAGRRLDVNDRVADLRVAHHQPVFHDVRDAVRFGERHLRRQPHVQIEKHVVL